MYVVNGDAGGHGQAATNAYHPQYTLADITVTQTGSQLMLSSFGEFAVFTGRA